MLENKKFMQKLKGLPRNIGRSLRCMKQIDDLTNLAFTSNEIITAPIVNKERELIISFTTYNKRIHDVYLVVESIAQQTVKPNRLILWLDENEFTLETIPEVLKKQVERGLEIRFCPNYRSYKKLIPTLQCFPSANVITIDDDILYPVDMIRRLVEEHNRFPDCVIGHNAHQMKFNSKNEVLPYKKWEHGILCSNASKDIFLIGVGGVFYPARCLSNEVLNKDVFLEICPYADDIWFKAMGMLNGVHSKKVDDDRAFNERFFPIPGSQDIALFKYNIDECGNDRQLKAVFEKYDLFKYL